jgi:alpha-beta hydrolase superfamily lysophospholipase
VDDLKSAIKFAKVKGYKKIALHGHSLGSLICLRCYSRAIKTMVLTGASTGPVKYNWSEYYSKDQLRELAGKGCMTARADSKWRKQIRVDKSLLAFFETINQKELLARVKCPVLIIHGNNKTDEEEKMLLANSKRGMKFLPPGSRLEIIEGAGHSLEGHLGEVLKLALEWYRGHLGI